MIKQLYQIFIQDSQSLKMLRRSKKQRILIKIIRDVLLIAIVAFIIGTILNELNIGKITNFIPLNIGNLVMIIGFIVSFIVCFLAAINFFFISCYLDKNLDNYLSLPIKVRDFTIAKLLATYRNTLFITSLVMIPTIIIYFFTAEISIITVIFVLLYFFTMPIIVIYTIVLITSTLLFFINRMKNKRVAKKFLYTIVLTVAIAAYLYFVFGLSYGTLGALDFLFQIQPILKVIFAYPLWFIRLFANEQYLYLIDIILALAACILVQLYFEKIYYKSSVGFNSDDAKQKKNKHKNKIQNNSIFKWFFLKEAKEIFKTSVYFFNTIFGNIIVLVIFLIISFYNYFTLEADQILMVNKVINSIDTVSILLIVYAIATFASFFNTGAATVFSRDAKNFYYIKTLPIKYHQALLGKTFFHFLVDFIALAIFMIVPLIFFKFNILIIFLSFCVILLVSLATILIPVCIDLLFPTLDWESETSVVKQSKSVIISLLFSLVFSIVIVGLGAFLLFSGLFSENILLIVATVFYILLLIGLYLLFIKLSNKAYLKY